MEKKFSSSTFDNEIGCGSGLICYEAMESLNLLSNLLTRKFLMDLIYLIVLIDHTTYSIRYSLAISSVLI